MHGDPGPMVRRRQLGNLLRRYRNDAGLSVKDVAGALLCAPSKISRIETAQRNATQRDVRDLCNLYGLSDPGIKDELMTLARDSRERGWWKEAGLDPALETLIGMEGAATVISEYQTLSLPGLLQIREYADAILEAWRPGDPFMRHPAVDVRMRRQKVLQGIDPPKLDVILDEAALHRFVGGREVMQMQLKHLAEVAESHTVRIQVIPFSAGAHIGMNNGFTVLDFRPPMPPFAESPMPAVVYVEGIAGDAYYDRPQDVQQYVSAFVRLKEKALSPTGTLQLLRSLI